MGETRVDLLHLLEDLRDAYPESLEETILSEIVANCLDGGAARVRLEADPTRRTLTVADDGEGMQRRQLARYHDVAATTKTRGKGIGFAGVGMKLALLLCEEVVTETRRGKTHVATRWHLLSRHKAPWKWIPPPGMVEARGTAVGLTLDNALSPLLDAGFVEGVLRRHFQPLVEPAFADVLAAHYPRGLHLEVNGAPIQRGAGPTGEVAPLAVRIGRKRKPAAVGYLERAAAPLPADRQGLGVSTLGKVIKRGWEWLGVAPSSPECCGGLIEVPALAECLTLNKADFIRTGARGATFLAFRKAIQEAVSHQLAAWGDARESAPDPRRRAIRPLERDLERVLSDMAEDFPLLAALVERRPGGQKKIPLGVPEGDGEARALVAASLVHAIQDASPGGGAGNGTPLPGEPGVTPDATPVSTIAHDAGPASMLPGVVRSRRPSRYGLEIHLEEEPGRGEIARLVESTVWVNAAHPAYLRAAATRSEGYHFALAVALALAPLAVEPSQERMFITTFLARWGRAASPTARRASRS